MPVLNYQSLLNDGDEQRFEFASTAEIFFENSCITMQNAWRVSIKVSMSLLDAAAGMLVTQALLSKHSSLPLLVFISTLARNIYKNVNPENCTEEAIFLSLPLSVISVLEEKPDLVTLQNQLSRTPVGKTYRSLRNTTREDIYHASQNLFQFTKSTAVDVAMSTKNLVTTSIPNKWNSLPPLAQSTIHYFSLGTSFLCIAGSQDESIKHNLCSIALCLSVADYAIRKLSKNTCGLFSGIARGACFMGNAVKHAVIEGMEENTVRYTNAVTFS